MVSPTNENISKSPFVVMQDQQTNEIQLIALPSDMQIGTKAKNKSLSVTGCTALSCYELVSPEQTIPDNTSIVSIHGVQAVYLPTKPREGQILFVKDGMGNAGTSNITLSSQAGVLIDNAATSVLDVNYGSITLYFGDNEWHVLQKTIQQTTGSISPTGYAPNVYSMAPNAVTAGVGTQYMPTDLINDVMVSDGSTWMHRQNGTFVTPPVAFATDLVAVNPTTDFSLTQKGPYWRMQANAQTTSYMLRGWFNNPSGIIKDVNGSWTIEIGITNTRTWWQHAYGTIGIFATDVANSAAVFWVMFNGISGADDGGIGARYYANIASTATSTAGLLYSARNTYDPSYLRIYYNGVTSTFYIYYSVDGLVWNDVYSGAGWAPAFGAPFDLINWGIALDDFNSPNLQFGYPGYVDIVHVRQQAGIIL